MKKRAWFITFEGAEGSGKSTQIREAEACLKRMGKKVLVLREPGGTRVSEKIREILLDRHLIELNHSTELLLYLAARAQIVEEKILPALRKGTTVIMDRYEDSTFAYQGFGRNIPISTIETISRLAVRGTLKPDMTFLLDIDPRKGMKRGGRHDRMERQSFLFHQKVRKGFLALAKRARKRYHVIDASQAKEEVSAVIRKVLERAIGKN